MIIIIKITMSSFRIIDLNTRENIQILFIILMCQNIWLIRTIRSDKNNNVKNNTVRANLQVNWLVMSLWACSDTNNIGHCKIVERKTDIVMEKTISRQPNI